MAIFERRYMLKTHIILGIYVGFRGGGGKVCWHPLISTTAKHHPAAQCDGGDMRQQQHGSKAQQKRHGFVTGTCPKREGEEDPP